MSKVLKSAERPKPPAAGRGRKKGVPNKATADVRAAVALLAQGLVGDLEAWIRKGAKKNPLLAARVAADLFEYHIPRLSRAELTGEDGGPVETVVQLEFKEPEKS